jgi:hypothetical protein
MQLEDLKIIQTTSTVALTDKLIVSNAESKTPKAITVADFLASMFDSTITPVGTTGARTINKNAGSVNFAAGAASLVVTNSLVSTNSVILGSVGSNDSTMKGVHIIPAAGSFTLHGNALPTGETRVNFLVIN